MNARPRKFDVSDKLIMGNMADLMVRELWGAYEHEHKQRVMQLIRVVGCSASPCSLWRPRRRSPGSSCISTRRLSQ